MLDRTKLLRELHNAAGDLFPDCSNEFATARRVWEQIVADPMFQARAQACSSVWVIPSWQGALDAVHAVEPLSSPYMVCSVDGSQIYPDRHQGTSCFLINTGIVQLRYGLGGKGIVLDSIPTVYTRQVDDQVEFSQDLVNCRRQEHELQQGFEASLALRDAHEGVPLVFFCDGSLIFWHLQAHDEQMRDYFLASYFTSLMKLYDHRIPYAGYISLSKSKELVNLLRIALCNFRVEGCEQQMLVDRLVDTNVASFFLKPGQRSTLFQHHGAIVAAYPEPLRPYFFYLHVGDEIARIEIPSWIAHDEELVRHVASIALDQARKGYGYPVALAEAHEQAVVKGPDREFFYHVIQKLGVDKGRAVQLSLKSAKKRYAAV